jgi:lactate dehydrogenase-like 2-hydroxyacid dehydrogenase
VSAKEVHAVLDTSGFTPADCANVVRVAALDREGNRAWVNPGRLGATLSRRVVGVGVDRIDLDTCARRGIAVTTTPGALDDATADLTFALILATRRRVVEGDRLVRSGGWPGTSTASRVAEEVIGATLGIVGLGHIGTAVAQRAHAFRMRVL